MAEILGTKRRNPTWKENSPKYKVSTLQKEEVDIPPYLKKNWNTRWNVQF